MSARWATYDLVEESCEVHVAPLGDSVEHLLTDDCVCGPSVEPCEAGLWGAVNWLVVHHSLDGREANE